LTARSPPCCRIRGSCTHDNTIYNNVYAHNITPPVTTTTFIIIIIIIMVYQFCSARPNLSRMVCKSPPENRSVIEPRPSNIYLHLNEISAANGYNYYTGVSASPFNGRSLLRWYIVFILYIRTTRRCCDIRWPVRETNLTDGRPVTRENTSDAIFRSIGFHGPKPRARVIIIIL